MVLNGGKSASINKHCLLSLGSVSWALTSHGAGHSARDLG